MPDGTGSGNNTVCGTGTHLDTDGMTCVPDGAGATGAPTITGITPSEAGASGSVLFQIDGTGFAGADITDLHVYFGDTTPGTGGNLGPCEAEVAAASDTQIGGEVPPMCDITVNVTVVTNKGMATTPFKYDALFAADGDGGGAFGQAGDLYILDPFVAQPAFAGGSLYYDLGPIVDSAVNTTQYGMAGITFDSAGKLWGVTTGDSPGDAAGLAQLVTIAPATANGPTATVVGPLKTAGGTNVYVTDIKFSGTTLYGWGVTFGTTRDTARLVTINTTTGAVTLVGTGKTVDSYDAFDGGLAIDTTGNILAAGFGAGADTTVGSTGVLNQVTTAGAMTAMATLNYPVGARVNALTYIGTTLIAVVDNGSYGADPAVEQQTGGQPAIFGEVLAVVDPTNTMQMVGAVVELPAQLGAQSHVDAMDMAPTGASIARKLDRAKWAALKPATAITKP